MLNALLRSYEWYDHPEGLKFVETHRDVARTSGHWLLLPGSFSAFHRVLNNEELWYIHEGRITLHIIDGDGVLRSRVLGSNVAAGEAPVIAVPVNCWQAAEIDPATSYGFGSVVCAPAFAFGQFEIARRKDLLEAHPGHAELITRLTLS
jgi:predicted cupin superfamily sugar epimerase